MLCAALLNCFEYTAETIRTQVSVVDHAESLTQPFDNSQTINWLLGHIVSARTTPLGLLGAEIVWSDACRARYRHGSSPINLHDESVLRLEQLLSLFNKTHCLLQAGLRGLDEGVLLKPSGHGKNNVFESLLYFHFHESYHVGQMTMLADALCKPAAYLASATSQDSSKRT